eukprot:COSAG01_NODE_45394_length_409_cov_9.283871_2_plen_30_part_01
MVAAVQDLESVQADSYFSEELVHLSPNPGV